MLTAGTTTNPTTIAKAPALIGDAIYLKNILEMVIPMPVMKQAQTPALVTPFQYSPYKKGAKNAPAKAPQEIPINCAMNVGGSNAKNTDTATNATISRRIRLSCFFSPIPTIIHRGKKSNVNVEADVKTREDKVDMDADNTSTITIPIRMSGSDDSIWGIIPS